MNPGSDVSKSSNISANGESEADERRLEWGLIYRQILKEVIYF